MDEEIAVDKHMIARFHHSTAESIKESVLSEIKKSSSMKRVVMTSFEMGLDLMDVLLAINVGAPQSLESFAQQSGCGGRSIDQSFSLVLWQGSLGKNTVTNSMKKYALSLSVCHWSLLTKHFQFDLEAEREVSFELMGATPADYRCCDICKVDCKCGSCLVAP